MKASLNKTLDNNIYTDIKALTALKEKAAGFNLLPMQPINSLLAGKHASKLKGRGLNFDEMRQYAVGDDIRALDWKVTMRTGKPYVKVYTEERERNVILLVDQRQSMFFGSTRKMKSVIAAELAALLAWRTLTDTDRVGAVILTDTNVVSVKPNRSEQHVGHILADIAKYNQQLKSGAKANSDKEQTNPSLSTMLNGVCRYAMHDALIVYIGDGMGWDKDCSTAIKKLRQHNEVVLCYTFDQLEHELPDLSQLVLSDGQLQIELTKGDQPIKQRFEQQIADELANISRFAKQYRVPLLQFNTIDDADRQLRQQLGGLR